LKGVQQDHAIPFRKRSENPIDITSVFNPDFPEVRSRQFFPKLRGHNLLGSQQFQRSDDLRSDSGIQIGKKLLDWFVAKTVW
jgi:hypothetical protein